MEVSEKFLSFSHIMVLKLLISKMLLIAKIKNNKTIIRVIVNQIVIIVIVKEIVIKKNQKL